MITKFEFLSQYKHDTESEAKKTRQFIKAFASLISWMDFLDTHGGRDEDTERFIFDGEFCDQDYCIDLLNCISILSGYEDGLTTSEIPDYIITTQDGHVFHFAFSYDKDIYGNITSFTINLLINGEEQPWIEIDLDIIVHEAYYTYLQNLFFDDVEWINQYSMLDVLYAATESVTIVDIVNDAIALAIKGELTGSNLRVKFIDSLDRMSEKSKYVLDTICDSVNSISISTQITSMCECVDNFTKEVNNAVADEVGSRIQFTSDVAMSSSFLLPISTIVSTVTGLLSAIVALVVTPAVGLAVGLVGTAVSSLVSQLTENERDTPLIADIDQVGNFCFSNAIMRRYISSTTLQTNYPELYAKLLENGYMKLVNGFTTTYMWFSGSTQIAIEVFLNMTCDCDMEDSYNQICDYFFVNNVYFETLANQTGAIVNHRVVMHIKDDYLKRNVQDMFVKTTNFATCGAGGLIDKDTEDEQYYEISRRLLLSLSLLCYIAVNIKARFSESLPAGQYQPWNLWHEVTEEYIETDDDALNIVFNFWSWIKMGGTTSALQSTAAGCVEQVLDGDPLSNKDWYGIVMAVIPALRRLLALDPFWWILNTQDVLVNDGINDLDNYAKYLLEGDGDRLIVCYDSFNRENPYILPPKSRFNIWARVAFTVAAVAAVVITAMVVKAKVKRWASYKAAIARSNIQQDLKDFNDPDNPLYQDRTLFNKILKSSRRYNLFWGSLSGTSYDPLNNWVNYPSANLVSGGVLSTLTSKVIDTTSQTLTDFTALANDIHSIAEASPQIIASAGTISQAAGNIQQSVTDIDNLINDPNGSISKILDNVNIILKCIK